MKKFYLYRKEDETGVSGTGIVAEGVIFHNGVCALCWRSDHPSVAIYQSIDEVKFIHGHHGKTVIRYGKMRRKRHNDTEEK
mgnify:CR=1 FL=1